MANFCYIVRGLAKTPSTFREYTKTLVSKFTLKKLTFLYSCNLLLLSLVGHSRLSYELSYA